MSTPENRLPDDFSVFAFCPDGPGFTERTVTDLFDKEQLLREQAIKARYAGNKDGADHWSGKADQVGDRIDELIQRHKIRKN
jgi:hypothetical protein